MAREHGDVLRGGRRLRLSASAAAIALTSVAANLAAIIGGVLVFERADRLRCARDRACCLVIAGAALMPAPMRAIDAA